MTGWSSTHPLPFTSAANNSSEHEVQTQCSLGLPQRKPNPRPRPQSESFWRGSPLWPCPSINCGVGHLKEVRKNKGGVFAPCDQKDSQNPETCQVSCTILNVRGSDPAICELCLSTVGRTPSLGVCFREKRRTLRAETVTQCSLCSVVAAVQKNR